jgi:hypothetical protein
VPTCDGGEPGIGGRGDGSGPVMSGHQERKAGCDIGACEVTFMVERGEREDEEVDESGRGCQGSKFCNHGCEWQHGQSSAVSSFIRWISWSKSSHGRTHLVIVDRKTLEWVLIRRGPSRWSWSGACKGW